MTATNRRRFKKRYLLLFLFLLLIVFISLWNYRPRPEALVKYRIEPKEQNIQEGELYVQFLGNTNLLFSDGTNSILTDGFFTRPNAQTVLWGEVEPNPSIIKSCLKKAGINELDAVIPVHSHFDHAMDAAMVADFTGGKLIGSSSTANIGLGYGLIESQMMIPEFDSIYEIGKFKLQFVKSNHWQYPDPEQRKLLLNNKIEKPLKTPASIFDYKEGDSYTILVEHDSTKIAIQGSAGFKEGSLPKFDADILFLAIAGLETMDETYNQNYQDHLIEPLQAEVLVPIHWDDFTTPLQEKLKTTNAIFNMKFGSNLGKAFEQIEKRNLNKNRVIKLLPTWKKFKVEEIKNIED